MGRGVSYSCTERFELHYMTMFFFRGGSVNSAEPPAGSRGRAPGQGEKLKDIHLFDAVRRAKFGLLSR